MKTMLFFRTLFTFAALLLSVFANAQMPAGNYPNTTDAQGRKQGAWQKKDAEGHTIYIGQFKDDKPTGTFTYYDAADRVMVVSVFSANGTICYSKMYHINGKLQAQGKYINQQKDSVWLFFNDQEQLVSQEGYKMGKKDGPSIVYYPGTKQIAESKTYKNGLEEGPWLLYYPNGTKKSESTYVAGNLEGKYIYYFEDGKINILGAYQHAVKNGVWTYYKPDGTVKSKETYVLGKLQGGEKVITPEEMQKEQLKYNNNDDQGGGPGGQ